MRFGDIASYSRGLTFAKGDVASSSTKRVLRSNNIDLQTHSLNLEDVACLKETFVIPEEKKLHKGDIFICMSNGSTKHLGKVAFVDSDMEYAFGGFMGAIHPDSSKVFPKYSFYACLSSEYRRFLESILNGININNLKWSDLSNFKIPVPSLSEQERIVAELDLLSGIIDKQKAQRQELDILALSIYHQMFGDNGEKRVEVQTVCLSDIASFERGLVYKGGDEVNISSNTVLRSNNIDLKSYTLSLDDIKYLREDFIIPENKILKKGDIFICMSNGSKSHLGKVALIESDSHYAFGGFMGAIKANLNSILPVYLYYSFRTPEYASFLQSICKGANINNLKFSELGAFRIMLPAMAQQELFAEKIEAINLQKEMINRSIVESQQLFNYTMDKYFG